MKISPFDIYNQEFNKTTFGYNTKQVDAFMEDVGMAYEKSLKDISKLQETNKGLKEKLKNYENLEEQMKKIMVTIQETAKEQSKQAEKKADYIIKKAEIKADKIEEKARQKIKNEYQMLERLKENRDLFEIRLKTLLESHLEMLEKQVQEEKEIDYEEFEDADIKEGKNETINDEEKDTLETSNFND